MTHNCDNSPHSTKRLILLSLLLVSKCNSAKILAIMPTSSFSHQIVFQPLWRELSLRGHQVFLLTTHPMGDSSLTNLTELHLDSVNDFFKEAKFYETLVEHSEHFLQLGYFLKDVTVQLTHRVLGNHLVQDFLRSHLEIDLVVAEAQFPSILGLVGYYRCPWIGVSSLEPALQYHLAIGNPAHPVLNPDSNLDVGDPEDLSFKERVFSFVYRNVYMHEYKNDLLPRLTGISREYLGRDLPELVDVQGNISMLFTSAHPVFHNVRPVYGNTIFVGSGMHLKKPEPLPDHIRQFLAGAKNGAIYFSLGSNVNAGILNEDFFITLVDTFATLPYRFIMKLDVKLLKQPKNVMVEKWLPQQDILRHPKIKLFITQGGLQSLQEALTFEVPIIGIPFFGDQLANVNKAVNKGYGLYIDKKYFSKRYLNETINEMMGNPKYAEKVKELGAIFRDEETPSLQRAVYWTEYVIRHKGAPHLRSPAAAMPAWQFYMLDVIAFFFLIAFVMSFLFFLFIYYSIKLLWKAVRMGKKPAKKSKRKIR